jgi:SAM-dependent methyltransferase
MADSSTARNLTHDHLLAVLHTELSKRPTWTEGPVRILDVGCGSGRLALTLQQELAFLNPTLHIEVHGVEASDYLDAREDRKAGILKHLQAEAPEIEWDARIHMCPVNKGWPFADGFFHIVVSNQVFEHVEFPESLFSEINRVLTHEGFSVHLFPLGHCLWEDHIKVPFAARIRNHDLLMANVYLFSLLGLGRYRKRRRLRPISLQAFVEREVDYLHHFTHYKRQSDYLDLAKKSHLRASYRYTGKFYSAKIRTMLGLRPAKRYQAGTPGLWHSLLVFGLRYVSSVTLFLEKKNTRVH